MAPGSPSIAWDADPDPAPVRVRGLKARYGRGRRRTVALRGVDLRADPGEITALVGPNGAGKTTLLRVLLGFLPPWRGTVEIGGMAPALSRRVRGTGYLPETVRAPAGFTVRRFFREGARLARVPAEERSQAEAGAMRLSGLGEADATNLLTGLSRGTFRRAQLAFALMGAPGLVLLDEPWSGLDPRARTRLRTTVQELADRGATVILASHELEEIQRVAHTALLLRQGKVLGRVENPQGMPPGALERRLLAVDRG